MCGLQSDYLPTISGRDFIGISCERCGNYYMDGLLAACGDPTNEEDRAILSGFTRWQKELGNPIPDINTENIERIIENNRNYSDEEKVDKLLLYYSKKQPKRGSLIPYDVNIDYPITFSNEWQEFFYLLSDLADKTIGVINVETRDSISIKPEGWKRIEWLKKIELADEKYNIEVEKIIKKINSIEAEIKEKASLKNRRWSSVLARKIRDLYLQGTIEKLEKKPEIDRRIILGLQIVSKTEDINFLSGRIGELAEFEKNFLTKRLSEIYQDCRAQSFFGHDIAEVYSEVDKRIKEILVDLKIGGLKKEEVKISELPEKNIKTLIEMDESTQLEFKSTFQWDIEQNCKNKNLRNEVIKTIAAFNNTEGGYLLIGVKDDKKIFGLERDYSLFKEKNKRDVFLQTLTHEIENKISNDFATKIDVKFYNLENKNICRIKVTFGSEPVWVKEDKNEVFYIRLQNLTKALSPRKCVIYIKNKWKNTS